MKLNKNKEWNEKNKIVNQQERKILNNDKKLENKKCTAPQKLDMKNLTFGVFFYEINL